MYWIILISGLYILPVAVLLLLKKVPILEKYFKPTREIFKSSYLLVVGALIIVLFSTFFSNSIVNTGFGNFLLHFIGGGVNCSLVFEFIKKSTKLEIPFILEIICLFFLVSGLGVANELLEFLLDSLTNLRFSLDRLDTWKDLVANTLGAYTGFGIWKLLELLKKLTQNTKTKIVNTVSES